MPGRAPSTANIYGASGYRHSGNLSASHCLVTKSSEPRPPQAGGVAGATQALLRQDGLLTLGLLASLCAVWTGIPAAHTPLCCNPVCVCGLRLPD